MAKEPTPYVTTAEAARVLGVDMATVRGYVRDGHLPAVRLPGGRLRILREDLRLVLSPGRRAEGMPR